MNVILRLNGVDIKMNGVDIQPMKVEPMSVKDLAERLKQLNEMNEKTPGLAYEAARSLDDELEQTECGLRVTSTEDWEYMLYYKAPDQSQESILISQLIGRN